MAKQRLKAPKSEPAAPSPRSPSDWRAAGPVAGAVLGMQTLVWIVLYEVFGVLRLGYWFFDLSDLPYTYFGYAHNLAQGMAPYRDFFMEYPPLFVAVLYGAGNADVQSSYVFRFAFLMVAFMIAAGIVTAFSVMGGPDRRRPYIVAAVFSAMVLALGPISANRYDATVAFVLAIALLFMMRGSWLAAGIALGLGFALKITPAMLLPLVLILAPTRKGLIALAGFAVAAIAPFLLALTAGGQTAQLLGAMLSYHLSRPLEMESVLAVPLWIAHLAGMPISIGTTAGSQVVLGGVAGVLASASAVVLLAALGATFWLAWRRRERIASDPSLIALAALATMLGSLVGSKVLSPQYLVWIIPAAAIVALDRKWLGILLGAAMLATQIVFPGLYMQLFHQQALLPAAILVVRNLLVTGAFGLSVFYLWKLEPHTATRKA